MRCSRGHRGSSAENFSELAKVVSESRLDLLVKFDTELVLLLLLYAKTLIRALILLSFAVRVYMDTAVTGARRAIPTCRVAYKSSNVKRLCGGER